MQDIRWNELECILPYSISFHLIIIIIRDMLKSALRVLVKRTKTEILHWKMVKSDEFDFLKVKILLNPIFVRALVRALVSITLIIIINNLYNETEYHPI